MSSQPEQPTSETPLRWTLMGHETDDHFKSTVILSGPPVPADGRTVEVMPVAEHEEIAARMFTAADVRRFIAQAHNIGLRDDGAWGSADAAEYMERCS